MQGDTASLNGKIARLKYVDPLPPGINLHMSMTKSTVQIEGHRRLYYVVRDGLCQVYLPKTRLNEYLSNFSVQMCGGNVCSDLPDHKVVILVNWLTTKHTATTNEGYTSGNTPATESFVNYKSDL